MVLEQCWLNLDAARRELEPHGRPDFPCAGFLEHYTDSEEGDLPWHWHEELEIVFISTGRLELCLPGKVVMLGAGEACAINSNLLHSASARPACTLHSFVFNPLLITGSADSVFARKYLTPLTACRAFDGCVLSTLPSGQSLAARFEGAFTAASQDAPGYEFTVREALSGICLALYEAYEAELQTGRTGRNPDDERIRKMLDFIHGHYAQAIDLAQIARAASVGERECLRCFQRVIQISPVQYLLKYRVTQGAAMLQSGPYCSIAEVALRCGFDSPSNFSQVFHRFFKCTPREYREKC